MKAIVETPKLVDRVDSAGEIDCARAALRSWGLIDRRRVDSWNLKLRDPFVAAGLIQMYAKDGRMDEARESFRRAAIKDAVVWSTIITANARAGDFVEALDLVRRMLLEGVQPDAVALTAALAACTRPEALVQGKLVHACVLERGYEADLFVVTALVSMYGKCGSVELARAVFDRSLRSRNIVLWTCMIRVYVQHCCFDRALGTFRQMLLEGVRPNQVTFVSLAGGVVARSHGCFVFDLARESRLVSCDVTVTTALMGMFSRCRDLCSCEALFHAMLCHERNLSSWNVMLGAYSEDESRRDRTFHLFRIMLLEGLSPDRVSFLALLAACTKLSSGKCIHRWLVEAGLDCDPVISTALVSMYGRCGSLECAFQVFDCFDEADMVFWNSMIGACVEMHAAESVDLFRRMQLHGVKHNEVTLVSVLRACAKCQNLALGKQLHDQVVASGAESCEFLQNALLSLYGACGSIKDACNLFVMVDKWTVVSCTAMIAALSESCHYAEAMTVFRKMLLEGVTPNKVTLSTVLGVLGKLGTANGLEPVKSCCRLDDLKELAPGLITLYGKLHLYSLAADEFSKADKQEVVLWNSFLAWCDDPVVQYKRMLLDGVAPDKVTYISLLQSSRDLNPEELLRVVHAGITALGLEEDAVVATGLLRAYGQCKQVGRAMELFRKLRLVRRDDAVVWTSMLSTYADNDEHGKAVELLQRMQLEGVKPDKMAFVKALNACAACGGLRLGSFVHSNAEAAGVTLSAGVGSALVSLYASLGKLEVARQLFEKLPHKDVCSWTALISAYSDTGQHEAAVETFRRMQHCGIQADSVSVLAVLKSSPEFMSLAELGLSLESSSSSRISISTELMSLHGKHGKLDEASFIFDQMEEKDSVAWNAILSAYAQHGHMDKAIEMFQRMQQEGVTPDSGTFASITCACSHSGMVKEGGSYFAWMLHEFGVARLEQNYASMVDLLGRAGQLEEAERAASCSNVEGSSVLWKTMLSSCRSARDVRRGVDAASEVLSDNLHSPETYVLLSTLLHGTSHAISS